MIFDEKHQADLVGAEDHIDGAFMSERHAKTENQLCFVNHVLLLPFSLAINQNQQKSVSSSSIHFMRISVSPNIASRNYPLRYGAIFMLLSSPM